MEYSTAAASCGNPCLLFFLAMALSVCRPLLAGACGTFWTSWTPEHSSPVRYMPRTLFNNKVHEARMVYVWQTNNMCKGWNKVLIGQAAAERLKQDQEILLPVGYCLLEDLQIEIQFSLVGLAAVAPHMMHTHTHTHTLGKSPESNQTTR